MLTLAGVDVRAHSVAGIQTCIELPRLGVAFDVGFCPRTAVPLGKVLVSHAHPDHVGGIGAHVATRELLGMGPATYVVPRACEAGVARFLEAFGGLDGTRHDYELRALSPGEELFLGRGRIARPFFARHRVPCQGYAIWERRSKLRPELVGLPGTEIARLKREGRSVTIDIEVPEVVYSGDTLVDVVESEEVVRKARLLILELTFLGDDVPVEHARSLGHVHLDEVAARAELFENEAILFTHFSARYSRSQIVEALDRKLPPALRARVTPLLTGHGE